MTSALFMLALVAWPDPHEKPQETNEPAKDSPLGGSVVWPASCVFVDGLPALASWQVAGTVAVGARDAHALDRLIGTDGPNGARLVTIDIRRDACPPAPPLTAVSPWPKLGY